MKVPEKESECEAYFIYVYTHIALSLYHLFQDGLLLAKQDLAGFHKHC